MNFSKKELRKAKKERQRQSREKKQIVKDEMEIIEVVLQQDKEVREYFDTNKVV